MRFHDSNLHVKAQICKLFLFFSRRIGENLNASASPVENELAVSSATQAKENVKTTVGMVLLPKPRVPYPRFSRFSQREQRSYVDLLVKYAKISANSKAVAINKNDYLQYLVCILFFSSVKKKKKAFKRKYFKFAFMFLGATILTKMGNLGR